jgi:uncharacterized protein (UPF0210 family)
MAPVHIRSITLGIDVTPSTVDASFASASVFFQQARRDLADGGFDVQTIRLATQPPTYLEPTSFPGFARQLDAACLAEGIDYVASGGIRLGQNWDEASTATAILDGLTSTDRCFASLHLDDQSGLSPAAARTGAAIVDGLARVTPDGFSNLKFAAMARCGANIPFFPSAYHRGGPPCFSLAVQWADVALAAVSQAESVVSADQLLRTALAEWGAPVQAIAERVAGQTGVAFAGIDLTPAPFPTDEASLVAVIERLAGRPLGAPGTLAAVARLTQALKQTPLRSIGFCGAMLPVMEDSVLARRVEEDGLSVHDLLLYSALCGTGLDTVPLPGDVDRDTIAALLTDVAALGVALNKPLTARLFPIPGKRVGDSTSFEFAFFANTRVMSLGQARREERP